MPQSDALRLVVRVARMYYEWGKKQSEISDQLGLSQATVSRLLAQAKAAGLVRISVSVPPGLCTDLEEELVRRYKLRDTLVVECSSDTDERIIQREIGAAAAYYLETIIRPNEIVGISSWSASLLALVEAMHPVPRKNDIRVIQILGGVGNPQAETHAHRLTSRFADLVGGAPVYLPAPGIVGSEASLQVLLEDPYVQNTLRIFDQVTLALVGIGAGEPSPWLADSGNIFSREELEILRSQGAVGDILLRFFDRKGSLVKTPLDSRVVSMHLAQLKKVDRSIGVAGGQRKHAAIQAAARGGWINILVTDQCTAEWLLR
jgi:DNA-binding transcriptional regulator LsrR (DeoR family)